VATVQYPVIDMCIAGPGLSEAAETAEEAGAVQHHVVDIVAALFVLLEAAGEAEAGTRTDASVVVVEVEPAEKPEHTSAVGEAEGLRKEYWWISDERKNCEVAQEVLLFCAGCLVLLLEARVRRHPDRYHSNESPPQRPTEVVYLPHSKVVGLHHGAREYPSIASAFVCSAIVSACNFGRLDLGPLPLGDARAHGENDATIISCS
jgi:hypothetical protein